jgi:predicted lactoylglutathione lyase
MRMIFVNLPVKDLEASKRFFSALGFTCNPQFTDENAACMVIDENIFAMLLVEARFRDFIVGEIADATKATEVLTCLSAASREEVDDLLAKALANGGKAWKPVQDYGAMYGASFQDPDGHVWELMWMDPAAVQAQEPAKAAAPA